MKASILFIYLIFGLLQCGGDPLESCADDLIAQLKSEPVRNPPAEVWEYTISGKKYFFVPSYCCDFYSDLYDSSCKLVCHPDGGITGEGDGKCGELKSQLVKGKLLWKDERE